MQKKQLHCIILSPSIVPMNKIVYSVEIDSGALMRVIPF